MSDSQRHYGAGAKDCKVCIGVGYISYNVPVGDPRFGKIFPCICRQHPEGQLLDELRRAGLSDPQTVIDRQIDWKMKGRERMSDGVKAFLARQTSDDPGGQMVLASSFGCGKTALLQWLTWQLRVARVDAIYVTAERFKEAVNLIIRDADGWSPLIDRMKVAPVVVMDQLDWIRERVSGGTDSFTAEIFRDVFDARYRRRDLATAYSVNLAAWEKGGEGVLDAIYDRMKEGEVYIMRSKGIRDQLGQTVAA